MIYETAEQQGARFALQNQARQEAERRAAQERERRRGDENQRQFEVRQREAERRELLAPLRAPAEVVPVTNTAPPDPDAQAPDNTPIEEWMRHENKRADKQERARGGRGTFWPGGQNRSY